MAIQDDLIKYGIKLFKQRDAVLANYGGMNRTISDANSLASLGLDPNSLPIVEPTEAGQRAAGVYSNTGGSDIKFSDLLKRGGEDFNYNEERKRIDAESAAANAKAVANPQPTVVNPNNKLPTETPEQYAARIGKPPIAGATPPPGTPTPTPGAPATPGVPAPTDPNATPGAPAAPVAGAFSGPNLSQGSTGPAVLQLQQALGGLVADGQFGPKTLAAVKSYQLSHGLTPDGIVGPVTMAALNAPPASPIKSVVAGAGASAAKTASASSAGAGGSSAASSVSTAVIPPVKTPLDKLIDKLNNQSPQKSFTDVYKEVYNAFGLNTVKQGFLDQTKAFSDLQEEKNKEKQEINNNPWYSEGIRVSKLRQLDAKFETRELISTNKLKLLETQIDNGRQDAQFIAGQTMDQLQQTAKLDQDIISKGIEIAEKEIEAAAKLASAGKTTSIEEYEYAVSQGYKGTFSSYQNEDANRKAKAGGGGTGLTPSQINTTVNSIAGAFDNEPIVKAYNTVQEGFKTISSIGVNTVSPADDIAFIYAFAKIMDPNSVVREGEYNTIQKYAQTWANNFGFTATRIFSNTNFLTADAKQKMLNALQPKVTTISNQYKNLESEYQRQVNDAYAGKPRQITNYAGDNNSSNTPSKFDYLQKDITVEGTQAWLPRSVWNTVLGADKDALLVEAKADGFTLLIKD